MNHFIVLNKSSSPFLLINGFKDDIFFVFLKCDIYRHINNYDFFTPIHHTHSFSKCFYPPEALWFSKPLRGRSIIHEDEASFIRIGKRANKKNHISIVFIDFIHNMIKPRK